MRPLRALIVEDSEEDTKLLVRALERGYVVTYERVETAEEVRGALKRPWDIVLCDWVLPRFSAHEALATLKTFGTDLPFIIISGAVGEETAIEALKAGAHDFLVKGRFARLLPAVERELKESATRRNHRDAERSLRESEERFRTLVQSINDIVFTLDLEGRMTAFYGAWPQALAVSPQQLVGKTVEQVIGPKQAAAHRVAQARALKGESVVYDYTTAPNPATNGAQRHFSTSLAPIRDPIGNVTGLVAVVREVSELKRLQSQLLASDRLASVGMLAAGIAHEVNNPLATVIANLDLALTRLEPNPEIEELIREARSSADRVRQITSDLKVFSRAEDTGKRAVDVERVLESSLRLADNEVRHRAKVVKAYGHVPPVLGDESRLGQVFLNLMVNAAQTIAEGHPGSNEIRVTTSLDSGGRVVVDVADTGKGELAAQSNSLAICERLIETMGGTLSVQSELGRGTVFHVTLPRASVAPMSDAPLAKPGPASRRGKVLVVDDEPMLANAIRRLLAPEHDVTVVNRAEDALSLVGTGARFDLILSDLMMPEMTGMDLHSKLTQVAAEQAAVMVFMTGGAFTTRARDFLEAVTNPRVDKPFDSQHLLGLINGRIR